MRSSWRYALVAGFLLWALGACSEGAEVVTTTVGPGDQLTTTTQGVDEGPDAIDGPSFRVGLTAPITTANWWAAFGTSESTESRAYLGTTKTSLFTLSMPGFVHVPALAATNSPAKPMQQGGVWVVEQSMRDDQFWSDGEPITTSDLEFYFDTVREFRLGNDHDSYFPPSVLTVAAVDEHTIRVEFDVEPTLAMWQTGVAMAPFVPAHFWEDHVKQARAMAEQYAAEITEGQVVNAIVAASLADEIPGNNLAPEDVTQEDIDDYIAARSAEEAREYLYLVDSPKEPSAGPQVFDSWEEGDYAVTVANPLYYDRGTEKTLYADGSVRISSDATEDDVYGGEGSGEVLAQFMEGPFVSEIIWLENDSEVDAYERLAAGELDYVYNPDGITPALRSTLDASPSVDFSVSPSESIRYLAFNLKNPPLSDQVFREAVGTVINKELVVGSSLSDVVVPAYTMVHPDLTLWHNPDVNKPGWRDNEPLSQSDRFLTAIEMLKDAGYTWDREPVIDILGGSPVVEPGQGLTMPNGVKVPELEILAPGLDFDPLRATFSIWIERWLNDLGIPAVMIESDFAGIIAAVFPPQTLEASQAWDMYVLGWQGPGVLLPGQLLVALFHSQEDALIGGGLNTTGFDHAEFDEAADAFVSASTLEEAQRWTKEMERIVQEQLPYVLLFRTQIIEAFDTHVRFPTDTILGGHSGFPGGWPSAARVED